MSNSTPVPGSGTTRANATPMENCAVSATAMTSLSGRTNVFAMMEPFLPKLLRRSGIEFKRAGRDIDYHGLRAPYFIKTEWAIDNLLKDLHDLYQAIHAQVSPSFPAGRD